MKLNKKLNTEINVNTSRRVEKRVTNMNSIIYLQHGENR